MRNDNIACGDGDTPTLKAEVCRVLEIRSKKKTKGQIIFVFTASDVAI